MTPAVVIEGNILIKIWEHTGKSIWHQVGGGTTITITGKGHQALT